MTLFWPFHSSLLLHHCVPIIQHSMCLSVCVCVCVCARVHGCVCVAYTHTIIYASHTDTKRSCFNFSVLPVDGLDLALLHTPQNLLRVTFKSCVLCIFTKSQTFVPRKSYGDGTCNH